MSSRTEHLGALNNAVTALFASQVMRFGVVSVAGVIVDIAVGWFLATELGMPLTLAAAIGFMVAAALNYVLHARWTFAGAATSLSVRRGGLYLLSLGATLATRLGVVALLQQLMPDGQLKPLLVLVPAIGASFLVNFLLNKLLVFRSGAEPRSGEQSPAGMSH